MHIFLISHSFVLSILHYGPECWKTEKESEHTILTLQNLPQTNFEYLLATDNRLLPNVSKKICTYTSKKMLGMD